uniref:Uncharacterized protein n=1 Tax=Oryza rufipogon TaxID=4529 RepID=A0A0E0NYU8_ORYRU
MATARMTAATATPANDHLGDDGWRGADDGWQRRNDALEDLATARRRRRPATADLATATAPTAAASGNDDFNCSNGISTTW